MRVCIYFNASTPVFSTVNSVSVVDLISRVEDMTNSVEDLSDFVSGAISPYLELLTGEKWVLFKDKLNFKWPGGGGFTCHQDYPAYDLLGPAEHITAMIVIDDATDENGCLKLLKTGYKSHIWFNQIQKIQK